MKQPKQKKSPFDLLIDSMAYLAGLMMIAMTLLVAYAVTLRYLNLRPPIWVLQYTEYGLLWITFLAAAWLLKRKGHIRIDTLITHLPVSVARKLDIFNSLLGFIITLTIVIFGTMHTIDLFSRGILEVKSTNVPKYLIFWIIPFGSLTLCIQFARDAIQNILDISNKDS